MVSESISDLDVGVCSVRCLFVWSYNPIRHIEDIVSAWGSFVTFHIGYGINFYALYKYEFLST